MKSLSTKHKTFLAVILCLFAFSKNLKAQENLGPKYAYNLYIQPLKTGDSLIDVTVETRDTALQTNFVINKLNNKPMYIKGHLFDKVGDMSFTLVDSTNKYILNGHFIYGERTDTEYMMFDENGNEMIMYPPPRADSTWIYTSFDGKILANRKYNKGIKQTK